MPAMAGPGAARLLVRVNDHPVAFHPVEVPAGGWTGDDLKVVVAGIVAGAGPAPDPRPDPRPGPPAAVPPSVTVIVTTCVASDDLVRVLDGLRAQTVVPDAIVVVDNRPATSGVRALLASLDRPEVRLVEEPRRGLSHARNAGLAAATTDVVVYADDDLVLDKRWIESVRRAFGDPEVACVTGLVLPAELATRSQLLLEEFGGFAKGFRSTVFRLGDGRARGPLYPYAAGVFGTGGNSSFRASVLRALGGFDPVLGTGTAALGGEDLDIHLRVVLAGHALAYEPSAIVWHHHHRTMRALRRQLFGYGAGLSAMLTRRVLSGPGEAAAILRRAGAGLLFLLSPASPKNHGKSVDYPRHLTLIEIAGFIWGPFALVRSMVAGAKRRGAR
jgi:GT2 family glycosyltransferase